MRVKLEWLNELVDLTGLTVQNIVKTLSLYSTEVEEVFKVIDGSNLVVGHVLNKEAHPDSDHLSICQVDVGTETLQIVCGAPNVAKDQYVIVALVGAVLPNGIKIKKSKIRGVESSGMLCSLNELGMEKKYISEQYSQGIYYFTDAVKAGDDPLLKLNLNDEVIELGLTPNRADLFSMLGVAYEISAVFDRPLKPLTYSFTESNEDNSKAIDVKLETELCKLYYAKVIKNIQIKQSPTWLSSRLIAFGVRPINNVVDITNYILALFGQPVHAFDYAKLGNKIAVRKAEENETIITLDNIERKLLPSDIVITDTKKPVAIAGVMGGLDTEITPNTKDMVLEVAVFDPISIRLTSARLDLRSEASTRYEKGVDINRAKLALDYACYLLQTLANGEILKGDVHQGITNVLDNEVSITSKFISNYLGITISDEDAIQIIKRLNFKVEKIDDVLNISVPSRRSDVSIKADIVEEVGRIFGYEKLPITLPYTRNAGGLNNYQANRRTLKHRLAGLGLSEAINYSLVTENNQFKYNFIEGSKDIELMYPITKERRVLRRTLIPSLLGNAAYAINRKVKDIAIFEIANVYYELEERIEEELLAITIAGDYSDTLWSGKIEKADFFVLKGILEEALKPFDVALEFKPFDESSEELHPKRTAWVYNKGTKIGIIGDLHPKYSSENDLKDVVVCEIRLKDILNSTTDDVVYKPVSKVPSVERDIAIVIDKHIPAQEVINTIKNVDNKILSNVTIFDLYIGDKLNDDEKSIALKLVFTSDETLTDEIINNKVNKILKVLEKTYSAVLRS